MRTSRLGPKRSLCLSAPLAFTNTDLNTNKLNKKGSLTFQTEQYLGHPKIEWWTNKTEQMGDSFFMQIYQNKPARINLNL